MTSVSGLRGPGVGRPCRNCPACGRFRYKGRGHGGTDGVLLGQVNDKTLSELGWSTLCAELSARARTPMGRERCLALLPGDEAGEARPRAGGGAGGGGPR